MSAQLHSIDAEPLGTGIVEMLEEVLVEAREGKLSSVALATVLRDGTTVSRWSYVPSYGLMLGAITRLAHRLNVRMDG